MRAVPPSVSFSMRWLSSATTSIRSMFLRPASAPRLAAAYLIITVAAVMMPMADISETLLDEPNTPINQIVVGNPAALWDHRQSVTTFVPRIFAQRRQSNPPRILPTYVSQLTHSRTVRELFCSFRC
jgi:hypothetical protein